jgi:hypothetical protein
MKYLKIFEEFFDSWEEISPEEWYDSKMENQPFDETEYDTLVNFCVDNAKYKKGGVEYTLDYDYVNAVEHVNSIFNLRVIIKKKFNIISEIFYPLNFKFIDLNLFYIVQIIKK